MPSIRVTQDSPESSSSSESSADSYAAAEAKAVEAARILKLRRLADSQRLEYQFLIVPFEQFKRTVRNNHRIAENEVSAVISAVPAEMSGDQAVTNLTAAVSKLRGLKLRLEEHNEIETLQLQRCRTRLDHLETASVDNLKERNELKLKRILVDYLLRMHDIVFATKLAETYNIQDLVDIDAFLEAKEIIDFLHNKKIPPALAWCAENRFRLNEFKSKFEFHLRRQEFIELLRVDNLSLAVEHARNYLAPWGATFREELEHVMGAFAFSVDTECETYKVLFEEKQWDYLVEEFKREFRRLYGITVESLLDIHLQAGLTALKTLSCYEGNCPKEDPFSQAGFRKLAEQLPLSNHPNSKLICYISKQPMDDENLPLVLPNGYVYSLMALLSMASKNEGEITCPRTGDVCDISEIVTAHIKL